MKAYKFPLSARVTFLLLFTLILTGNASGQTILYVSNNFGISTVPVGSSTVNNFIPLPPGGTYDLAFGPTGNLFASNNGNVYEIGPGGAVSTFATGFSQADGLAFDSTGNLFVADLFVGSILKITPQGVVTTFASGLNNPFDLVFDLSGNLYVSNDFGGFTGNGTISKITSGGVVTTFATGLFAPTTLAFDDSGNLFVNEAGAISKVTPSGNVSIFVETSSNEGGMLFDVNGNLLLVDGGIQLVTPQGNKTLLATGDARSLAFGPASFSAGIPEPAAWAWLTGGLALALAAWRKSRR